MNKIRVLFFVITMLLIHNLMGLSSRDSIIIRCETIPEAPSNWGTLDVGTIVNPYLISNLANLRWLSEVSSDWWVDVSTPVYFLQTADIDASETMIWNDGEGFFPIGHIMNTPSFIGVYDGGNHIITDLYIGISESHQSHGWVGLFGYVGSVGMWSIIKNLGLINIYYNITNGTYLGGIAGVIQGNSLVENCFVLGNILNSDTVYVGGIVGAIYNSSIINCYSHGTINSSFSTYLYMGGIVGQAENSATVSFCYTSSELYSSNTGLLFRIGGIIGNLINSTIVNCFWDLQTTGKPHATYNSTPPSNFGLSTFEMKQADNYINNTWDFIDIWEQNDDFYYGYPYLQASTYIHPTYRPQELSITPGDAMVTLEWSPPLEGSIGSITNYIVYHRLEDEIGWTHRYTTANPNTFSWIDTSLQNGETYFYHITAVYTEPNGETASSNIVSATPYPIIAPNSISAEIIDNNIIVSWEIEGDISTISQPLTKEYNHLPEANDTVLTLRNDLIGFLYFELQRNEILMISTIDMTYTDLTPLEDISYVYRVRAVYEDGESDWVAAPSIFIPIFNPVFDLTAEIYLNINIIECLLGWSEPLPQNHGNGSGYGIYRSEGSVLDWILIHQTDNNTTTTYIDFDILFGSEYYYYIVAVYNDLNGVSEPSNIIGPISITSPPLPSFDPNPEDNATQIPLGQILSWSNSTTGSEPMGLKIYFDDSYPPSTFHVIDLTTFWTPIPALQYSQIYYWQVVPYNNTGDAIECPIWSFTTAAENIIFNPPQNLIATGGDMEVYLLWEAPEDQEVGTFSYYNIYKDGSLYLSEIGSTVYTDVNVINDIEYSYYITANYEAPEGESEPSNISIVTPQAVQNLDVIKIPLRTELIGNYPNPFNPSTIIKYTLNVASHLRIDIYNIKGQKIKTLVNSYLKEGNYTISWNGKDENEKDVVSGVYFYKMSTDEYIGIKKMIIMK